ncbi:glycolate oxidase subunit GlcF [Chitinivorax sp. PXF-14]|uniref:glycolate oxidase subunit GlcF n=1 Tax=Chitinivorax sp. PXF-14 TaxID=3230488 RepID=UPI00346683CD
MHTELAPKFAHDPDAIEAAGLIQACVHCGFCNATCPTYQLRGDELDGPRGRIYLIKQMLEGREVTEKTQLHLDRCLTCRACESTCPSGVQYGHLVEAGRRVLDGEVGRIPELKFRRIWLNSVLPRGPWFALALRAGRLARPLLPRPLVRKIPTAMPVGRWPQRRHPRKMLLLDGCVQPAMAPAINAATARVLDRLGIELVRAAAAGCCGAVSQHLGFHQDGLDYARRNIDAWWPQLEADAEGIVITASGCGAQVKDYGYLLRDDPRYAERAARVSLLARDVAEVLAAEMPALRGLLRPVAGGTRLAFHAPCSLQHGQRLKDVVEPLLQAAGYELTPVADAHLCCGSAGTYSMLQPELAGQLRDNKVGALTAGSPVAIATANIGCLAFLQAASDTPVQHWVTLLDACLAG